jgi:hypothetical protein
LASYFLGRLYLGRITHQPVLHAPRDHRLEQLAQQIALAKAAMSVLGKRRMIGNLAVETQATEPAVGNRYKA